MTDVLKLLPPLMWRSKQYPTTARRAFFRHEGVDHIVQYRDFEFVEQLGAHGLMFSYTIPAREEVARGPYSHLFEALPVLFQDMLNREAESLTDPVYGNFRCVPVSYDESTDPNKRDGADVQVEFRFSPDLANEDPNLKDLSGIAGIKSSAGRLDEEVAKADWRQEPSPEPTVDVLQAADGVVSRGLAEVDRAAAALDDFAFKLRKIEDACDRAENPQNWAIRDSARNTRESTIRLRRRLAEDPATKLRNITARTQMLLTDLAKEVGMTLEDLLRLNPGLARLPYVRAGTPVTVRATQRAA